MENQTFWKVEFYKVNKLLTKIIEGDKKTQDFKKELKEQGYKIYSIEVSNIKEYMYYQLTN